MRKKIIVGLCMITALFCLGACTNSQETTQSSTQGAQEEGQTGDDASAIDSSAETTTEAAPEDHGADSAPESGDASASGSKVLVAYFTRLPNTESGDDLDAVVQGGGPYGAIGDSYATADMDAISSASITVIDGEAKGNVETVAQWIGEITDGDLFSIETVQKYPLNYDTLIELGGQEQAEQHRPELSTHLENIDEYSVIFLGYPNWYHDMPMALYTFLEEYDMAGKTIIPFCVSAGNGLANTASSIQDAQPEATVVTDGLSLHMREVPNSQEAVTQWVNSFDI